MRVDRIHYLLALLLCSGLTARGQTGGRAGPSATSASGQGVLHSTLETVNVISGERQVRCTAAAHFEDPNWTPDGKALIFDQDGTLQRLSLDGGPARITRIPITPAVKVNGDHGISPDGSMIAIGYADTDGQARIYVVPIAGGTPRRVTSDATGYFHTFTPDGKIISFTTLRGDKSDTYTVPVAGGPATRLLADSDVAEFWPDGQWISFQSDRTGHSQIWRMHPDGSEQEQLVVSDTVDWFPHISPNGKLLAFLAYPPGTQGHPANLQVEIRVLSLADGKVRTVAKLLGGRGTMNVPSWSPDSTMVAFTSYELLPQ